jgi:transposase
MWTTENRHRYDRDKLRYPCDLTDEEWAEVEPMIQPAKRDGRRREVDVREVLNGVMYVLSTGCPWRYILKDLPPRSTLYDYMQRWGYDGTLGKIHYELYQKRRDWWTVRPVPPPVIDRQSLKSAERGACIDPKGYDAGKKISGKKRHILVDTEGLLMHAVVHPADLQDRDGGVLVLATLFGLFLNRPGFAGGSNSQIGWSHDKSHDKQVLSRSSRPGGADGAGA